MSLESRSRIISLRLTDEEYIRFRRLCGSRGVRNVSELVREAVSQLFEAKSTENPSSEVDVRIRIATLECKLADLATAVEQMEARLTPPLALGATAGSLRNAPAGIDAG